MEIQQCPVLYPSWKEFKHFNAFVSKVEKQYKNLYGMVKVVPPPEWRSKFSDYPLKLEQLMVSSPIEQNIFGKSGIYECLHMQKKSMSLKEYREKMVIFDRITSGRSNEEIEAMFWKNIVFSPPLYGADLVNTLMDDRCGEWNLNKLDSLLRQAITANIKGVTSSYCYVGSWKTLFCWHKEDLDLSAINYLHEGKAKYWYSIPECQGPLLEREVRKHFPEHFSKCGQHLRHKTTLVNPYLLKRRLPELRISKVEHRAGEFMLVLGGSYHCGFNSGFNIAEAINYATIDWLPRLPLIRYCECSKQSVRVNNYAIMASLEDTSYAKSAEFQELRGALEREAEEEEEREKEEEAQLVKREFSKKIRKERKGAGKVVVRGEEWKLENWVQCDKCDVWRRVRGEFQPSKRFECKALGKLCNSSEKYSSKDMIVL